MDLSLSKTVVMMSRARPDSLFTALLLVSLTFTLATAATTYRVVHPGRHVCMKQHHVQTPVKRTQTYCKPVYKKEVRPCDGYRLCTSFRVVYQVAYREMYRMERQAQIVYACCPGWTQKSPAENGCTKPVCTRKCENGGQCIKPEVCRCPAGWSGLDCKTDIDECAASKHRCQHKCVNKKGGYKCACHEGFNLAADKRSCTLCLECMPDYKNFVNSYENLVKRVSNLENEKSEMQKNMSKLAKDQEIKLERLQSDMAAISTQAEQQYPRARRPRPGPLYHPQNPAVSWQRIASLSEQISLLEERLEGCTCNHMNNREGRRPGS